MMLFKSRNKQFILINQYIFLISCFSFLFSIYFINNNQGNLVSYFHNIIFISKNDTYYSYLFCTIMYILLSFIFSTSYIGIPFISLSITYRILLIIFSICSLFHTSLDLYKLFVLILPQIFLEIMMTYLISFLSIQLSFNSFYLTFVSRENYEFSKLINYFLNLFIIIFILVFLSIIIKLYLI